MAETVALSKFACPACGGEATWNPARQKLVCPFCGTESPATRDAATGAIIEHDLVSALRGIGDDARGWKALRRENRKRQLAVSDRQAVTRVREAHAVERRIAHLRSLGPNRDREKLIAKLREKVRA